MGTDELKALFFNHIERNKVPA